MQALKDGDDSIAENICAHFMAFEDLRDGISPIRVLHDGVTLSGIADMGPMLLPLTGLQSEDCERVGAAAKALLAYAREQVPLGKLT